MCELLGSDRQDVASDQLFTVGLLSVADALLEVPLETIVEELPLADEVGAALLRRDGPAGTILDAVVSYEQGEFDAASLHSHSRGIAPPTATRSVGPSRTVSALSERAGSGCTGADPVPFARTMSRVRIDALLSERGLFASRAQAAASVLAGDVLLLPDRRRAEKPGQLVPDDVELEVVAPPPFVSRGGVKLRTRWTRSPFRWPGGGARRRRLDRRVH